MPSRLVPLACAAVAAIVAVSAIVPLIRPKGWDVSALVRISTDDALYPPAHRGDPGFAFVGQGAFDGQFFYAIARDPLGLGSIHPLVQEQAYRYGHPLFSWLAWLFSAGGRPRAVPAALVAIGLACFLGAAALGSRFGRASGRSSWEGLLVALNPGLLLALASDLTEPLSALLLLAALLAYARGRRGWAIAAFVLLCFSKEQFVAIPLAIAAWEVWRARAEWRPSLALAASIVPVLLWWTYVRIHFGKFPFAAGVDRFSAPLAGWRRALVDTGIGTYDRSPVAIQLAQGHIVLLACVAGLFLVTGLMALRLRTATAAAFLPLVVVTACLSPLVLAFPKDVLRAISIPLLLIPGAVAAARRAET
jgi:hypothetical protein